MFCGREYSITPFALSEGSRQPGRCFFLIFCEIILLKRIGGDEDKRRKLVSSMFHCGFVFIFVCLVGFFDCYHADFQ